MIAMTNVKDTKLEATRAEVKALKARMSALEKLLERIVRQRPVSEKHLERVLRSHGLTPKSARR